MIRDVELLLISANQRLGKTEVEQECFSAIGRWNQAMKKSHMIGRFDFEEHHNELTKQYNKS